MVDGKELITGTPCEHCGQEKLFLLLLGDYPDCYEVVFCDGCGETMEIWAMEGEA
jgi:hypothetical protein